MSPTRAMSIADASPSPSLLTNHQMDAPLVSGSDPSVGVGTTITSRITWASSAASVPADTSDCGTGALEPNEPTTFDDDEARENGLEAQPPTGT